MASGAEYLNFCRKSVINCLPSFPLCLGETSQKLFHVTQDSGLWHVVVPMTLNPEWCCCFSTFFQCFIQASSIVARYHFISCAMYYACGGLHVADFPIVLERVNCHTYEGDSLSPM